MPPVIVTLQSGDGVSFTTSLEAARISGMISDAIDSIELQVRGKPLRNPKWLL